MDIPQLKRVIQEHKPVGAYMRVDTEAWNGEDGNKTVVVIDAEFDIDAFERFIRYAFNLTTKE